MFLEKHRKVLWLTAFLLTVALYHFLFSSNFRMDSSVKLVEKGNEFNDIALGRFGIVWLNRLLGMRDYNPYLISFLTLLAVLPVGAAFSFLMWKAAGKRCGGWICALPLMIFLTPNWIEQLYFSYQSFLVMLGILLTMLAVFQTEYSSGRLLPALAVIPAFAAFSVYQAFVPLYITLSAGTVLVRCVCSENTQELQVRRSVLRHALVFLAALAVYAAVNRAVGSGAKESAYLTSQIRWGSEPLPGVMGNVVKAALSVMTARGPLDTVGYPVSALCSLVFLTALAASKKERLYRILLPAGWLVLQSSVFAMLVILGTRTAIRAELAVTFAVAINFLLALLAVVLRTEEASVKKSSDMARRAMKYGLIAAMAFCLYRSASLSFSLIYTDDICTAFDNALTERLIVHLSSTQAEKGQKAVIFIGEPEVRLNAGCVVGETIGHSQYQHHGSLEFNNTVLVDLFRLHGLKKSRKMTTEDALLAEEMAKTMPCFPEEGSIVETDQIIVIKFAEDLYFAEEMLEPGYTLTEEPITYRDDTVRRLEGLLTDGKQILIRGHNLKRGVASREMTNTVYFLNRRTDELYRIETARSQRLLLSRNYQEDGVSYDSCGFTARCPMELFERFPGDTFEVLIKYNLEGEDFFAETGMFLNKRNLDRAPQEEIRDSEVRSGMQ